MRDMRRLSSDTTFNVCLQPLRWVTSIARHSRQRRNFFLSNLLSGVRIFIKIAEIFPFGCVNLHF